MEEGEQVMSEVHLGCSPHDTSYLSFFTIASSPLSDDNKGKKGRPAENIHRASQHGTSSANNAYPDNTVEESFMHNQPRVMNNNCVSVDESGDLVVPRRNSRWMHDDESHPQTISIYHRVKTCIPYVGLQIWKASLLLGDFLLHKMRTTSELDDVIGLELGAGTGLLGILLGAKAQLVFLTDLDEDVLDNCFRNVLVNSRKSKSILKTLRIRKLDWQEPWPPSADGDLTNT
eukprot:c16808_g1_i2 orf=331-1023(-)